MDSSTSTGSKLTLVVSSYNLIRCKQERNRFLRNEGRWVFLFLVSLSLSFLNSSSAIAQTAQPVTINFDTLPTL